MAATLHRTAHKRAKTPRAGAFAPVNTERFIVMMNREPRDYTRWRETHYMGEGETIQELGEKIMAYSATMAGRKRPAQTDPTIA